jgi:hypothetical protein
VAQNIDAAQVTARDTENMAASVVQAAEKMSHEALQLQDQVAQFVLEIQGAGQRSLRDADADAETTPNDRADDQWAPAA